MPEKHIKHGGKRKGAGRKKADIELTKKQKEQMAEMVIQRKLLFSNLHRPSLIKKFLDVLEKMLMSTNKADQRLAILTFREVYLKMPIPQDIKPEEESNESILLKLMEEYEKKTEQEAEDSESEE